VTTSASLVTSSALFQRVPEQKSS